MSSLRRKVMVMLRKRASPLERKLGYTFRNRSLLELALIHPSYRFETHGTTGDNQRLEFLGDAALSLLTAAYIYREFEDKEEGCLTALRSRVTSGRALAKMGHSIGLGAKLCMGRGEEKSGGRRRASNLADAFEAVVGAAYLDGGCDAVEKIFAKLFVPELELGTDDFWADNPKGFLQDVAQRVMRSGPRYRVAREDGPSHERVYTVDVSVNGEVVGSGTGANKRAAEASAAAAAIAALRARGLIPDR